MTWKWIWCGDFATMSGAKAWAAQAPASRTWGVVLGRATGLSVGETTNPTPPIDTLAGFTGAIHDEASFLAELTDEDGFYSTVRTVQSATLYRAPMVPDAARIFAMLSAQQRTASLDTLVVPSKSGLIPAFGIPGVEVISESRNGLRRVQYVLAYDDVGVSPLGEPAVLSGRIPAAIIEYRYRLSGLGLIEGQGRVRYPVADGSGDLPGVGAVEGWRYQGTGAIGAGRDCRRSATDRAGFLLGVGASVGLNVADPGPAASALLSRLSTDAKRDLVAAYERSRDEALLEALSRAPESWLDTPLPGGSARALALAELRETVVGPDGWTPWPSPG